jgi:hypothetical protein
MKVSRPSVHPATIVCGLISLLLTTVAALVAWPFCRPLLWFLFSLMALFFLFAATVISLSFLVIFWTVRHWLSQGRRGSNPKGPPWGSIAVWDGAMVRTPDLWDRWLDGI